MTKKHFDDQYEKFMNKLDRVLGEVKDSRQEQAAHQGQHVRVTDDIVDIKTRLKSIGTAVNP